MKIYYLNQFALLVVLLLHDWVPLASLNDIKALNKEHSFKDRLITTMINSSFSITAIVLTYYAMSHQSALSSMGVCFIYALFTMGAFFAWWKPYFFGCSEKHKLGLKEYESTHHFLPKRKDHPTPNTLHVLIHLLIIGCLIHSLWLLTQTI